MKMCGCGTALGTNNKSGMCQACYNQSPARVAKQRERDAARKVSRPKPGPCACGTPLGWANKSGMCQSCYMKSPHKRALDAKAAAASNLDPAKRERKRQTGKAYYEANRERILARQKAYSDARREYLNAYASAYRKSNKDKVQALSAYYHALQRTLFVERVYKSVVFKRDQGVCHLCNTPVDPTLWHLDHVIALSQGGPHSYPNTAVAHPSCNHTKGPRSYSASPTRWALALASYQEFHGSPYEG